MDAVSCTSRNLEFTILHNLPLAGNLVALQHGLGSCILKRVMATELESNSYYCL